MFLSLLIFVTPQRPANYLGHPYLSSFTLKTVLFSLIVQKVLAWTLLQRSFALKLPLTTL